MVSLELLSVTDISNELVTEKLNGLTPSWIISKRPNPGEQYLINPGKWALKGLSWLCVNTAQWHFPGLRPRDHNLFTYSLFLCFVPGEKNIWVATHVVTEGSPLGRKTGQSGRLSFQRPQHGTKCTRLLIHFALFAQEAQLEKLTIRELKILEGASRFIHPENPVPADCVHWWDEGHPGPKTAFICLTRDLGLKDRVYTNDELCNLQIKR